MRLQCIELPNPSDWDHATCAALTAPHMERLRVPVRNSTHPLDQDPVKAAEALEAFAGPLRQKLLPNSGGAADGKSFYWPHEVVAAPPGWTKVLKTCIRYCGAVFDHVVEAQLQGACVERGQPAADLARRARYTAATPAAWTMPSHLAPGRDGAAEEEESE